MTVYKIFQCPRCKLLLYCPQTQKTKKCPKCLKAINVKRTKILQTTNSHQDATFLVQQLKLPPELRKGLVHSIEKPFETKSKKERFLHFIQQVQETSQNQAIDEDLFLIQIEQADFDANWVLMQLTELEKSGLLFRPRKGYLQFLI